MSGNVLRGAVQYASLPCVLPCAQDSMVEQQRCIKDSKKAGEGGKTSTLQAFKLVGTVTLIISQPD